MTDPAGVPFTPRISCSMPANRRAAAHARALLRTWLAHRRCAASVVEAVELLATELVTNAVRHTPTEHIDLVAALDGQRLRVHVWDAFGDLLPSSPPRALSPQMQGGRGMWLLDRLSTAWGWDVEEGRGKALWFELPCPPADPRMHDP